MPRGKNPNNGKQPRSYKANNFQNGYLLDPNYSSGANDLPQSQYYSLGNNLNNLSINGQNTNNMLNVNAHNQIIDSTAANHAGNINLGQTIPILPIPIQTNASMSNIPNMSNINMNINHQALPAMQFGLNPAPPTFSDNYLTSSNLHSQNAQSTNSKNHTKRRNLKIATRRYASNSESGTSNISNGIYVPKVQNGTGSAQLSSSSLLPALKDGVEVQNSKETNAVNVKQTSRNLHKDRKYDRSKSAPKNNKFNNASKRSIAARKRKYSENLVTNGDKNIYSDLPSSKSIKPNPPHHPPPVPPPSKSSNSTKSSTPISLPNVSTTDRKLSNCTNRSSDSSAEISFNRVESLGGGVGAFRGQREGKRVRSSVSCMSSVSLKTSASTCNTPSITVPILRTRHLSERSKDTLTSKSTKFKVNLDKNESNNSQNLNLNESLNSYKNSQKSDTESKCSKKTLPISPDEAENDNETENQEAQTETGTTETGTGQESVPEHHHLYRQEMYEMVEDDIDHVRNHHDNRPGLAHGQGSYYIKRQNSKISVNGKSLMSPRYEDPRLSRSHESLARLSRGFQHLTPFTYGTDGTAPIAANIYSPGFQSSGSTPYNLYDIPSKDPTQFCNKDLFYLPYASVILKDFDFQSPTSNDEFSLAALEHELSFFSSEQEKMQFLLSQLRKSELSAKNYLNNIKDLTIKVNLKLLEEDDNNVNRVRKCAKGLKNLSNKVESNQVLRELVQQTQNALNRYKYKKKKALELEEKEAKESSNSKVVIHQKS